jgi:hypothetical protein
MAEVDGIVRTKRQLIEAAWNAVEYARSQVDYYKTQVSGAGRVRHYEAVIRKKLADIDKWQTGKPKPKKVKPKKSSIYEVDDPLQKFNLRDDVDWGNQSWPPGPGFNWALARAIASGELDSDGNVPLGGFL